MRRTVCLSTLVALLVATPGAGQENVDGFLARTFRGADGTTMPYRLFLPADTATGPLPLVVYLHGGGGAGTDNLRQISGGNVHGTRVWIAPELQARHPAFVLAPQLPDPEQWSAPESDEPARYAALVVQLIERLLRDHAIDPDRVYLTGQSRGGRGTWDLATKRPDLFAAAVPLCGEGTPSRADALRHLPVWAFHGADDPVIPVTGSREMVDALRAIGAPVRYTEYPGVGHNVWTRAYLEPELPEWLFARRRGHH